MVIGMTTLFWVSLLLGFCIGALVGIVFGIVLITKSKKHTLWLLSGLLSKSFRERDEEGGGR